MSNRLIIQSWLLLIQRAIQKCLSAKRFIEWITLLFLYYVRCRHFTHMLTLSHKVVSSQRMNDSLLAFPWTQWWFPVRLIICVLYSSMELSPSAASLKGTPIHHSEIDIWTQTKQAFEMSTYWWCGVIYWFMPIRCAHVHCTSIAGQLQHSFDCCVVLHNMQMTAHKRSVYHLATINFNLFQILTHIKDEGRVVNCFNWKVGRWVSCKITSTVAWCGKGLVKPLLAPCNNV